MRWRVLNQPRSALHKLKQCAQEELQLFLTALMFLSRLPIHRIIQIPYSEERLNLSSRYFPLAGLVIGTLCSIVLYLCSQLLPFAVSVALCIVFSLLLTGAFHEDGLADSADAFGGGWKKADVLRIMKDSRLGTYGVSALCCALGLKFICLVSMDVITALTALIGAHALSRALAVSYLYDLPYVQDIDHSKSKPLATQMSQTSLACALGIGLLPSLFVLQWATIPVVFLLGLMRIGWKRYLLKRIDGYTGDTLGAAQQLFEISYYLCLLMFI